MGKHTVSLRCVYEGASVDWSLLWLGMDKWGMQKVSPQCGSGSAAPSLPCDRTSFGTVDKPSA